MITAFPLSAMAATSGTCGDNLTWTLDDEGTLTISGTGAMDDWEYSSSNAHWLSYGNRIKTVEIGSGVTTIGNKAFSYCNSLTSATIPDSVITIGVRAFEYCTSLTSVIIPNSVTIIGDKAFYKCYNLTDVHYSGSEEDWSKISIGFYNGPLTNATIYYNYIVYDIVIFNADCQCTNGIISTTVTFDKVTQSAKLYVAVYDAEGSLYSLAEAPVTPDIMEYTLSAEAAEGEQRVKLFCIDSSVVMPLGKAYDCGVITNPVGEES